MLRVNLPAGGVFDDVERGLRSGRELDRLEGLLDDLSAGEMLVAAAKRHGEGRTLVDGGFDSKSTAERLDELERQRQADAGSSCRPAVALDAMEAV